MEIVFLKINFPVTAKMITRMRISVGTSLCQKHKSCFGLMLILYMCVQPFSYYIQSTLDISSCQGTNKFVRDIESSTYRVVIFCKLIRMGPIVLFETSRVRLIEYSRYRDSTVYKYNSFLRMAGILQETNNFILQHRRQSRSYYQGGLKIYFLVLCIEYKMYIKYKMSGTCESDKSFG